jgi:ribonuclease D
VQVYQQLHGQLEENGRLAWLDEEMAILTSPETYRGDPDNAWKRLVVPAAQAERRSRF